MLYSYEVESVIGGITRKEGRRYGKWELWELVQKIRKEGGKITITSIRNESSNL